MDDVSDDVRVRIPADLYTEAAEAINDGRLTGYKSVTEFLRAQLRDIPEEGA